MFRVLMILVVIGLFTGCNDSPGPPAVSGVVTAYGKPVSGATVLFVPLTSKDATGRELDIAHGVTDEEGRYQLSMAKGRTKVSLGKHMVLISKREPILKFLMKNKQESQTEQADLVDQAERESQRSFAEARRYSIPSPDGKRVLILSASQIADPFDRPQPLGEQIFDSFNRDTLLEFEVMPGGSDQANFEVGRDPLLKD